MYSIHNIHLTEDNYFLITAKYYDNPALVNSAEFFADLERIKYIKKLLSKYQKRAILKHRIILNHIIILRNCFGDLLPKMLFLKLEPQFHMIKPFLVHLNILPKYICMVGRYKIVDMTTYPSDEFIEKLLAKES